MRRIPPARPTEATDKENPSNLIMNDPQETDRSPFTWTSIPAQEPDPELPAGRRDIPLIHVVLFLATGVTTLIAGAMQQGVIPWETPWQLYKGLPFSLTLLLILFCHEMGHYLSARYHNLNVTLPYFLPAPPFPFIIGTFGAFIRIRSPILDKPALLDVGAAGPLAGLLVTLPLLVLGLQLSDIQVAPGGTGELGGVVLGESLLFQFLSWLTLGSLPPDHHIMLHPVAFAGWIGLLVTNINLIPVGQLDGGHVSYALFGAWSSRLAKVFYALLIVLGIVSWSGWLVWVVILTFMGFSHPEPQHYWVELDRGRKLVGYLTVAVFVLTFIPAPFQIHW